MELREYLAIARRWAWLFGLSTAVAATGAWVATRFMPTTYMSQTTLMVGRSVDDPNPNGMTIYLSQQLASTYAQMATRESVLRSVAEDLELGVDWSALRDMVKASPVPGQQLIEIRVIATDAEWARVIAQRVAEELIAISPENSGRIKAGDPNFLRDRVGNLEQNMLSAEAEIDNIEALLETETSARGLAELENSRAALLDKIDTWETRYANLLIATEGSPVNSLQIIEDASTGLRIGPNVKMNILLAAAIGFGLALAAVLALEYMDDTVKTTEEVEKRIGLPGLATIERLPDIAERRDGLVTLLKPRSPISEAFRVLRTNLQFALVGKQRASIVVTSANPGEGKSTIAANLAVVTAQAGRDVILIDADLRRPSLHKFFGLTNNFGLTSLMLDETADPEQMLHPVKDIPHLRILTSGPLPPNPSELLESDRAENVLNDLRERAELVLIDTPPVLVVADGTILAAKSDGTLLVFDSGVTRTDSGKRAVQTLGKVGIKPLGAVVNKLDRAKVGRYYYHYNYSYAYRYGYDRYYGSTSEGDDGAGGGPSGSGGGGIGPSAGRSARVAQPGIAGLVGRLRDALLSILS